MPNAIAKSMMLVGCLLAAASAAQAADKIKIGKGVYDVWHYTLAGLVSHQLDSIMLATENGLVLESKHQARILTNMRPFAPNLITQVIFARKPFLAEHADQGGRFLKAWFASVAYIVANKEKSSAISAKSLNMDTDIVEHAYDIDMPYLSKDGTFDPKGVDVLRDSFVELGILDKKPTDDQMIDTRFLPVKP